MSWTDQGPVSTPPAAVVYGAAILVACAALAGAGLGFHAAQRAPAATGSLDQIQGLDQAVGGKRPIVDLPSVEQGPVAAAPTNSASKDASDDDSNAIAVKQAAVQAAQSKPSQSASDVMDTYNTSPTEKPQAPAKPSIDETPPSSSSHNNDVPF